MPPGGRFCEHGNLRGTCHKCRAERKARWGRTERKEYAPKVRAGQRPPAKPWSTKDVLGAHEQAAVKAVHVHEGGVVRVPSTRGLSRIAFALLRAARHDADALVLLVPSDKAREAWEAALRTRLHVPAEEIDASGRAVRDWRRLPAVLILSPHAASRNMSGLRQHARRLVLCVDSPEHDGYETLLPLFTARFTRRMGFTAAKLAPPPREAWPRLDALGGIVHEARVTDAVRAGDLRPVRYRVETVAGPDDVVGKTRALMGDGQAVVWVDDAATGRALEEAFSRAGVEPRFLPGTATEGLARRIGEALAAGTARVLVTMPEAPRVRFDVDRLVFHAGGLTADRAESEILQLMAKEGRPVEVVDLVSAEGPESADRARSARRIVRLAGAADVPVPPVPWLRTALPVPPLPDTLAASVRARREETWQDTLASLPEAIEAGLDEVQASAALADHYLAARLGIAPRPLGPPPAVADDGEDPLLRPLAARESLVPLALVFPEALAAFRAVLAKDLDGFLAAYAGSPLLHHLAPEPRRMLLSTLEDLARDRAPEADPDDARGVAERLVRQGGASIRVPTRAYTKPTASVPAQAHLDRLVAGIEAEKALEEEESVHEIRRLSAAERQRQGRTLLGLARRSKERRDMLTVIRFTLPRPRGHGPPPELPYTELTPGSLVHLSTGDDHDPVMQGTVGDLSATTVEVLVEEDRERRAPVEDVRIDLVGNPKVYDTLISAVRKVYGAGALAPTSGAQGLRRLLLAEETGEGAAVPTFRHVHPGLNDSQKEAVAYCLGAPRLALVHGPPGTGKTTTLVEYLLQEVARGKRILVTADSNAAVDNILDAFQAAGGVGIRTGPRPSLTRSHLASMHIDTLRARAPGVDWFRRMPVVFSTHVSSAHLPEGLAFDVVVQDEASQATEPASCIPLLRAPKLILAGDHLQLPPVVRSRAADRLGLGVSLFERLHGPYGASHGTLLRVQYRMHPDIEAWSNAAFYDGRIETAVDPGPVEEAVTAGVLPASPRALFVDVAGEETTRRTSKERVAEADWIDDKVRRLIEAGVAPGRIAVIAAYRAQVRLLRRRLEATGVDVGTIDAFQGSERDVVVVSLVRANVKGEVGFVKDPRRLNVAMTRAKRHLVVVGDRATLVREPLIKSLVETLGTL